MDQKARGLKSKMLYSDGCYYIIDFSLGCGLNNFSSQSGIQGEQHLALLFKKEKQN